MFRAQRCISLIQITFVIFRYHHLVHGYIQMLSQTSRRISQHVRNVHRVQNFNPFRGVLSFWKGSS